MVIFEIAGRFCPIYSAAGSGTGAAFRLLRTCRNRVATAAANTPMRRTTENAVHGKCDVVNSLTKFFDD